MDGWTAAKGLNPPGRRAGYPQDDRARVPAVSERREASRLMGTAAPL